MIALTVTITNIIFDPLFVNFAVPLITVGLTVFVKWVNQNDKYARFRKEDLAVGPELAVTAVIAIVLYSSSLAQALSATTEAVAREPLLAKLSTAPWLLALSAGGLWATSTLIRKRGWTTDQQMHWAFGIAIPLLYGLLMLVFATTWIGQAHD